MIILIIKNTLDFERLETFVKPKLRNLVLKIQSIIATTQVSDSSNFVHGRMVYENLIDKEIKIEKLKNFLRTMKNKMMNELFYEIVPIF